jgi:3-deoxy-manno-octulosonate cytidylyltransferase (CMP-KDO synthetase)
MIIRVLSRARACPEIDRIIVATDSEEIRSVVQDFGGEAWLTSPLHRTGSDRVAEVADHLSEELILNLQGDEPLLPASTVQGLVSYGRSCPDLTVATARVALPRESDIVNPNIVKVVADSSGRALYFSRHPIPYCKQQPLELTGEVRAGSERRGYFKHVGIYLYRREFLLQYVRMESGPLEISESLEQLRILEHGYPVYLVEVAEDSVSVDTEADLAEVEELVRREASGRI